MFQLIRYPAVLVTFLVSLVWAQPANDLCNAATVIACGANISASTNSATFDKADLCGTNNTAPGIWYKFVGTGDYITLSTCNAGTDFDSKISVFEGSCTALTCITGNDDDANCTTSARASTTGFFSTLNKDYYILVHGFARATGNFDLTLVCGLPPVPPVNDVCSGASNVSCGTILNGSTVGATVDAGINCNTPATEPGVWYTFVGNGDRYLVSVCQANYDTRISLFAGSCTGLTCVTANDDFCGIQSLSIIRSVPNTRYYILVHGSNGATGDFTLDLQCESSPINDDCVQAAPITCGASVQGSTAGGSVDNTPLCNGMSQSSPGVWYSFTGNGDMASLSTCSFLTNFDTRLSVFTGSCTSLQCMLENDDEACFLGSRFSEASFLTTAGETYYVMVHGFAGATGDFQLNLTCTTPPTTPPNDLLANASLIACGDSVAGTTIAATMDVVPDCGMLVGAPGVWYTLVGTGDEVTLTTCNNNLNFDTQLGVFRKANNQLECVAGNDDDFTCLAGSNASSLKYFTNFGETYYILVQGFNGSIGDFSLEVSCVSTGPVVVEECQLAAFDPGNNLAFIIFLAGTPGLSPDYLPVGNTGRLVQYSDGTAEVTGQVVNRFNLNYLWDIHMNLHDAQTWSQWSAGIGRYKGGRPEAIANHPDWVYYKLKPGSFISGAPGSSFDGDTLWLSHSPADFTYGFQLGSGANDRNAFAGMSGWFTFSGAYSGQGDLNTSFTACQRITRMRIRAQLQGPSTPGATTGMRSTLSDDGILPLTQPFTSSLSYTGSEQVTTMPSNVTDWVLVELHDPADPKTVIARQAALLRSDGQLLDVNGSDLLEIELPGIAQWAGHEVHIAIRHPRHMAVMSAEPLSLDQSVVQWDAVKSQVGMWDKSALIKLEDGTLLIPAGDLNQNGTVEASEVNMVRSALFQYGAQERDINGDGTVNATDMHTILKNVGKTAAFPR
ncbi:MAG: dockerin type I domain-containing protein [Bacteroidia bacterium]